MQLSTEVLEASGITEGSSQVQGDQLGSLLSLSGHNQPSEVPTSAPRSGMKRENSSCSLGQVEAPENITVSITPEGLVVISDAGQRRFYVSVQNFYYCIILLVFGIFSEKNFFKGKIVCLKWVHSF